MEEGVCRGAEGLCPRSSSVVPVPGCCAFQFSACVLLSVGGPSPSTGDGSEQKHGFCLHLVGEQY